MIIATYAEDSSDLADAQRMIASLRRFGGALHGQSVWIVAPNESVSRPAERDLADSVTGPVRCLEIQIPDAIAWLPLAGKAVAAAAAESQAERETDILVWVDSDTIFLDPPHAFVLEPDCALAWCPVMHNRSGCLYDAPPDEYWSRIYHLLQLRNEMLFPILTPADQQRIRAYFHAGLLVARPLRRIFRRWVDALHTLAVNPPLAALCRQDRTRSLFLHQAALTGAILHAVGPDEMRALPPQYNYPLFFDRQYGATRAYDCIDDVITARIVVDVKRLAVEWINYLKGPASKIEWIRAHLGGR